MPKFFSNFEIYFFKTPFSLYIKEYCFFHLLHSSINSSTICSLFSSTFFMLIFVPIKLYPLFCNEFAFFKSIISFFKSLTTSFSEIFSFCNRDNLFFNFSLLSFLFLPLSPASSKFATIFFASSPLTKLISLLSFVFLFLYNLIISRFSSSNWSLKAVCNLINLFSNSSFCLSDSSNCLYNKSFTSFIEATFIFKSSTLNVDNCKLSSISPDNLLILLFPKLLLIIFILFCFEFNRASNSLSFDSSKELFSSSSFDFNFNSFNSLLFWINCCSNMFISVFNWVIYLSLSEFWFINNTFCWDISSYLFFKLLYSDSEFFCFNSNSSNFSSIELLWNFNILFSFDLFNNSLFFSSNSFSFVANNDSLLFNSFNLSSNSFSFVSNSIFLLFNSKFIFSISALFLLLKSISFFSNSNFILLNSKFLISNSVFLLTNSFSFSSNSNFLLFKSFFIFSISFSFISISIWLLLIWLALFSNSFSLSSKSFNFSSICALPPSISSISFSLSFKIFSLSSNSLILSAISFSFSSKLFSIILNSLLSFNSFSSLLFKSLISFFCSSFFIINLSTNVIKSFFGHICKLFFIFSS